MRLEISLGLSNRREHDTEINRDRTRKIQRKIERHCLSDLHWCLSLRANVFVLSCLVIARIRTVVRIMPSQTPLPMMFTPSGRTLVAATEVDSNLANCSSVDPCCRGVNFLRCEG